ncbi:MAG: MotA/TolQ/ExbB proton channel family protein, partial [Candidatus Hydrogenedentes bacterium]|nr:MotA/TolQ/ExbB proton channel family protein [Candidatus Hydrogenedentota bacterium]
MFETLGMLRDGGVCMVPLGACSLAAATIIIERALALRKDSVMEPHILRLVRDYNGEKSAESCVMSCRRSGRPLARVIEEVLQTRHLEHSQAIEAINATGRSQVARLERGMTMLEIIGIVSPLLGLLGTVLGMVDVFSA